jgi:glycosyltransferase involved in cell wall biosynthesis
MWGNFIVMRIGINLLPLRPGKNGGMEIYFRNLLDQLLTLDNSNEYFLITAPFNDSSLVYSVPTCKKILYHAELSMPQKIYRIFNQLLKKENASHQTLEKIIQQNEIELWFCPFLSLDPRPLEIPSLVTIPDIQHEFYPEYFSKEELSLRRSYITPSCQMATEIITISEFSKKSFIDKMSTDPEKIHVIHLAAGNRYLTLSEKENKVTKKYGLPRDYFFYPANGWPHKNHLMLLMGYFLYKKTYNPTHHLVLTGSGLKEKKEITDIIAQHGLQDYVHILNYVIADDLPEIYENATALVFPSLFEGFGIPLLEAMASGCPIIASNTTSIPEIAGDAAYFFDPKKPESICNAMHRITDDKELREQLIRNGQSRVIQFSYETVARKHLELFESAYAKRNDVEIAYHTREKVDISGVYADGWISKMEFRYRGPKRFRSVQMEVTGGLPVSYPMKMAVILNKKKRCMVQIPASGKHKFEFEFPDSSETNSECSLDIVPEKLYVPKKLAINNDERELSVILDSLILTDDTANSTQFIRKIS